MLDHWEYNRGDVIMKIGEPRKYVVLGQACQFGKSKCYIITPSSLDGRDYLECAPEWLDRDVCEGEFVKVGVYDFQHDREFLRDT